jgi:hypothetical protein
VVHDGPVVNNTITNTNFIKFTVEVEVYGMQVVSIDAPSLENFLFEDHVTLVVKL